MVQPKKNSNVDKKSKLAKTGFGKKMGTRTNRSHNPGPRDVRSVQEKKEVTICEDEVDVPVKKASKEPTRKEKKVKTKDSKENGMKKSARGVKASAEPVIDHKESAEKEQLSKTRLAILGLCNYVLNDITKSSASSYFDETLRKYRPDMPTTEYDKNTAKNRDNGPNSTKLFDHSRIKLEPAGNITSDYINASLVKFDKDISETEFIMTQYPSHEYTFDFWRMCWQYDISRVIAIFEPYEDEAIEEFRRIPDTLAPVSSPGTPTTNGTSSTTGSVVKSQTQQLIEGNSTRCDTNLTKCFFPLFEGHYMNLNGWLINIRKVEVDDRNKAWISTYHVELVPDGCSDAKMVRVFNCPTWPWKTLPRDDKKLLALVRTPWKDLPDTLEMSADGPKVVKHRPVVVMCDLGLDRSATIVFTYIMIEMVLAGKVPKPEQIFKQMREQRNGVFTQSMFYTYSIRAVLLYIKIKFKNVEFENPREPPETLKDKKVWTEVELALAKLPISGNATPLEK